MSGYIIYHIHYADDTIVMADLEITQRARKKEVLNINYKKTEDMFDIKRDILSCKLCIRDVKIKQV